MWLRHAEKKAKRHILHELSVLRRANGSAENTIDELQHDKDFLAYLRLRGRENLLNMLRRVSQLPEQHRQQAAADVLMRVQRELADELRLVENGLHEFEHMKTAMKVKNIHHLAIMGVAFKGHQFQKRLNRVYVSGAHNVPRSGPVVIASRHVIDQEYMLLQHFIPRHIRFVANIRNPKSQISFFDPKQGSLLAKKLAADTFGLICLHESEGAKESLFGDVVKAVDHGDCIVIFPEGTILSERNSLWGTMRYGTIDMVASAEEATGKSLPIIPVGLCYTWQDKTRKGKPDLIFRVGRPILIKNFSSGVNAHLSLKRQIMMLSEGALSLSYDELRAFEDQKMMHAKKNLREEMLAKEMRHLLKEADTRGELMNCFRLSDEMLIDHDALAKFLSLFERYLVTGGFSHDASHVHQILQRVESGRFLQSDKKELVRIFSSDIYNRERIVLKGVDERFRKTLQGLMRKCHCL